MVRRRFIAIGVASIIVLAATGCGRSPDHDSSGTTAPEDSVVRRGNGGDPQTLDPSLAEDVHAFNVLQDLYEGLVTAAADGSLIPGVAEEWEVSAGGRRYTFHIRNDALWSNGQAVTAHDFVAGFQRTLAADSTSPYSFLLSPILNVDDVTSGRQPVETLGVRASDAQTLVIELTAPASHFLNVLAMPIAFPLFAGDEFDSRQFGDPEHFVGNGPYVLGQRQPGYRIRLMKNAKYRNANNVSVRIVDYFPIVEPNTELNMYRAGELDITATVPVANIDELRRNRPDELQISSSLALYYLAFDLSEAPLNVLPLRKALSMAIDRRTLVQIIGRGEQAAFGVVPAGVAGYEPARYAWMRAPDEDRETQARRMYAQAGYSAANPLDVSFMYDVGDIHETIALAVAAMWRDVLGVNVTLDKREWKHFLATRENRAEWQIMRFAWTGDYNGATTFLDIFQSDSPQNLSGFRDTRYDQLLEEASRTIDTPAAVKLLQKSEQRILDEYAIAPLYFYVSKHLVKPEIGNFEMNILDSHPSQYLVKSGTEDSK